MCLFIINQQLLNVGFCHNLSIQTSKYLVNTKIKRPTDLNGIRDLEKTDLSCQYIIIILWNRVWPFIWKTWIPFTHRCFIPSLVEISPVPLEKIFTCHQCFFIVAIISLLIWQTRKCIPQGCIVRSLVEIGRVDLERKIFNVVDIFSLWRHYLHLEIVMAFQWIPLIPVCSRYWPSTSYKVSMYLHYVVTLCIRQT